MRSYHPYYVHRQHLDEELVRRNRVAINVCVGIARVAAVAWICWVLARGAH